MALKKLASVVSSLMGLRPGRQRIKLSPSPPSLLEEGDDQGGGETRVLACGHEFHRKCVDMWFKDYCRKTCPVCRFLVEDEEEKSLTKGLLADSQFTEEMVIWFSSFHVAGF
ncbi:hypothetical protein U1Q18_040055 [Sarracenia purpurea var. burkii]